MNDQLLKPFSKEEVLDALQQMSLLKSSRPDGFNACFFQSFWPTVGSDVSNAILQFLNESAFDPNLNSTYIVLIPKVKYPVQPKDFKPISLYNVTYKLASKVLTNRLKLVLPSIISNFQSAFIPK